MAWRALSSNCNINDIHFDLTCPLSMLKVAWNHLFEAYFVQKRRFGQKSGNMDICKYRKMVIQEFV